MKTKSKEPNKYYENEALLTYIIIFSYIYSFILNIW